MAGEMIAGWEWYKTLTPKEFGNGLAEIFKCAIIGDPELLSSIEEKAVAIRNRNLSLLERIVSKACLIKKGIVEIDRGIDLPDDIPITLSTEGVLCRIKRDKKREGGTIRFVLLKKIGMPFVNGVVPEPLIR
jgi:3-dehydroquinate synthetase